MFRLLGCSAVRLLGCSAARLFGGTDGTGGAVARRIAVSGGAPVAVRRFCAVPGLNPLFGPAFRTRFPDPLSGSASGLFRACFGVCFGSVSGSASRPASGSAFGSAQELFPGLLSGLVSRMQVLFSLIAECGVWFRSGRRIRLCDFCRSRFRRRACNSLLPVFLGLCREPVI